MNELKLSVPTYYGAVHCNLPDPGDLQDFDAPHVPVVIREADGVRIVLGTDNYDDLDKPDIQIERRPNGWAIFLHPEGGGDPSGYVYFLDDGRSFLLKERGPGSIEVLRGRDEPAEIDFPQPVTHCVSLQPIARRGGRSDDAIPRQPKNRPASTHNRKACARCGQLVQYSEDWYGELCPSCADQTDGRFQCRRCGQTGSFESLGGDGAADPICCGVPCRRIE